jgi:hypothetical protein
VVFINVCGPSKGVQPLSGAAHLPQPRLCSQVAEVNLSLFMKHFFSVFLVRNDFGGTLDLGAIISQFQNCSSLYHASIAVGALDLSRNIPLSSFTERKHVTMRALKEYHTSVSEFQTEIMRKDVQLNDVNLWTTFFLGLFEVSL